MTANDELEKLRAALTARHNASLDNIKKASAHDIHVNQVLRAECDELRAVLAEARPYIRYLAEHGLGHDLSDFALIEGLSHPIQLCLSIDAQLKSEEQS